MALTPIPRYKKKPTKGRPNVTAAERARMKAAATAAARLDHDNWTKNNLGKYTPPKTPTKPPAGSKGSSNPAPAGDKAAAAAAAVAGAGPSQAGLISAYNLERAKILQGMAPQIQDIYQQAGANIGSVAGGARDATHDLLYEAGGGKASAFDPTIDPRIAASYHPDAAPGASYHLGAVLPQDTLNKQGAAFGAAAAFAPGTALQEGQYALAKALNDEKVTNAEASKVNASVSKMLGYVADAYGNPIVGKNGKPIKLPEAQMTPYQKAQLGLSGQRLQLSADSTNARLKQSREHFVAGMNFKTAKAKADYEIAAAKGAKPNSALSAKYGYMVDSNGKAILNAKGRHIPVKTAATVKKDRSVTQNVALDKLVKGWYSGSRQKVGSKSTLQADGSRTSNDIVKKGAPRNYQAGLRTLMKQYKLKLGEATTLLDTYYQRGEYGRPYVSLSEARKYYNDKKYRKWGITPKLLLRARRGITTDAYEAYNAINAILNAHGE